MDEPTTPRIPPLPPAERDERVAELLRSLRAPGNEDDMNLFATLARHPRLLKRWSAFGGLLLFGGTLPARDRELVILCTARLCDARYEWAHHVPLALAAGLDSTEIDRIGAGVDVAGWDEADAALVRAVSELHADARISQPTWDQLATRYDEAQLIELCMLVGQYHLVAFTLNSLGIETEAGFPDPPW